MRLQEALESLRPLLAPRAVVAANGHISRALQAVADAPTHFYMIGSMGLASSIGLGLALARPSLPVTVLDGDGNLLMNLGALASVAAAAPRRLVHVVLDNGVYGSTGSQRTISDRVDLAALAVAAGYRSSTRLATPRALRNQAEVLSGPDAAGPAMLVVEVEPPVPGEVVPPRVALGPRALRDRFRASLGAWES
ncbi:MAG: sulfopyruvate decarboxylase subunit beta [Planctomycetes bacterium]|nr:sulfopyruvate decarboxylase subunit beta [Planctomycetota bacterium]